MRASVIGVQHVLVRINPDPSVVLLLFGDSKRSRHQLRFRDWRLRLVYTVRSMQGCPCAARASLSRYTALAGVLAGQFSEQNEEQEPPPFFFRSLIFLAQQRRECASKNHDRPYIVHLVAHCGARLARRVVSHPLRYLSVSFLF